MSPSASENMTAGAPPGVRGREGSPRGGSANWSGKITEERPPAMWFFQSL